MGAAVGRDGRSVGVWVRRAAGVGVAVGLVVWVLWGAGW